MLTFLKTAKHQYQPGRHPVAGPYSSGPGCFNLFNPCEIHLLPGQKAVVDFLLKVVLPPDCQGELRLKPTRAYLTLHAPLLRKSNAIFFLGTTLMLVFFRLGYTRAEHRRHL